MSGSGGPPVRTGGLPFTVGGMAADGFIAESLGFEQMDPELPFFSQSLKGPVMKRFLPFVVALLVSVPCFADEVDPRVKSVDASLVVARKSVDVELERAKEKVCVEYKKNCLAQVKVLEVAVKECERKVGVAKSVSDRKSQEALEAKLVDLKDELEGWKANAGKKWVVALEEVEVEEVGEAKPKLRVVGDFRWHDWVMKLKDDGKVEVMCDGKGLVRTDSWKVGPKGELVVKNATSGAEVSYVLKGGALVDVVGGYEYARVKSKK